MITQQVLDLTNHFVDEYQRLEAQYEQLRSAPAHTVQANPDLEKRLVAALADIANLKKSLAAEQAASASAQAALARANSLVVESNRLVAGLRSEQNDAGLKGCPHCDQLREQLRSRQAELQTVKSSQQSLQDRIRQLEAAPKSAAVDPHELTLLRQQQQVLRQEKEETAARLRECEKFKLMIEMKRLKDLNP